MENGKGKNFRARRIITVLIIFAATISWLALNPNSFEEYFVQAETPETPETPKIEDSTSKSPLALAVLEKIEIKGRAPKTGYTRDEFYSDWPNVEGCSLRQRIIKRELGETAKLADDNCTVISGEYDEPYTGAHLVFYQKSDLSKGVQIDHVVALSDAWQKGAQNLSKDERFSLATDPLNLLAVDAKTNQGKSDGDAATWLPPNKKFRCAYVARQISVKFKYRLWMTDAEKEAISRVLESCPKEPAIGVEL